MNETQDMLSKLIAERNRLKREKAELWDALQDTLPYLDDAEDVLKFMSESVLTDECRALVARIRAILAEIDR